MAYTIRTKDGITLKDIPDELGPHSPEVKARVEQARAHMNQRNRAELDMGEVRQVPTQPQAEPDSTAGGMLAQVNRALAPYAAGAAAGAAVGAPFAGVGAVPGAVAGIGAVGLSKLTSNLIIAGANAMMGTNHQSATDAIQDLMTRAGMPEPQTQAERIVGAAAETAADAGSGVGLGRAMAAAPISETAQGVGRALSSQPAAQIAGGAGAGAASQATAEAGGGPIAQMGAGLAGGVLTGAPFAKTMPRPVRAAEQVAAQGLEMAAPVVEGAAVRQVAEEMPQAAVGALVKKASGKGIGAANAKAQLADMAAINPEAKAAAERMGIELPPDVFSDNPQIRAAAGLTRSAAGSPAEAGWRTAVTNAVDKADEVMKGLGATFEEGQVSPGVVSQKVRDTLVKTRGEMNAEARKIYDQVDMAIPKSAPVKLGKVEETLLKIMDEVGTEGLSAQEKKLLKMVDSSEGVTYGRLLREKNLMGQALAGKESPYGNMEAASLKRLYGALAEDQLASVEAVGGEELRKQLHGANLLYAKERALGKRIVNAFGEDVEGSVANRMRAAISGGSKGASEDFAKLMMVVPEDLRKETVATALGSATRSARGAERGGFGFSEFAKTYQGLRANAPVYKQVVEALGPGSHEMLRDMYEVSRRVTDARAAVLTTGKANQALSQAMQAESLVAQVLDSTVAHGITTGAAAVGAGPVGAGVSSALMNALSAGRKDALVAAGEMFMSEEFKRLAIEAATKQQPSKAIVRGLVNGGAFKRFAKTIQLPPSEEQRTRWVLNAMRAENVTIQ